MDFVRSYCGTNESLGSPRLQSDHTVSKLSADAGSLWNTVKQASRPQVIHKTQSPICLDYRARNRPQLKKLLILFPPQTFDN